LDEQLDDDARRFVNDPMLNTFDHQSGEVRVSKIFDWYASDFENTAGSVRLYLAQFANSEQARDLLWNQNPEIEFHPYDWSLNAR
jgi:hypothetical protein